MTGPSERKAAMTAFLAAQGLAGAEVGLLAGDASFRKYFRLHDKDGTPLVLMDAPPPQEDVRPFVKVGRHLEKLGYSAPRILAEDPAAGFLLLEDLGDATYTRLLADGADEEALYALAVDLLADLHGRPVDQALPPGLPPYDEARLLTEAHLLTDWYMPAVLGHETPEDLRRQYADLWRAVFPLAAVGAPTLVLRDYHVDNLLLLDGRDGVRACGLLDFQDAVAGSVAYDLVSLLEDARRDIDPGLVGRMMARYHAARPEIDPAALAAAMAVLGAQRHAKVIGIFTRLCRRDGKPHYLGHIPRVWRLLEAAVEHPALGEIKAWLDRHMPKDKRGVPTA